MVEAVFFLPVFLVGLGATLVLSLLVARETDEPRRTSRGDAEEHARSRSQERYEGDDTGRER
jgi:hypothetical protein